MTGVEGVAAPDREAFIAAAAPALRKHMLNVESWYEPTLADIVDALWPLICQAREDGERAGRQKAAEAIEAVAQAHHRDAQDMRLHNNPAASLLDADRYEDAARLARGAQQPGKENPDGQ